MTEQGCIHIWRFESKEQIASHHPERGHVWWHWVTIFYCERCLSESQKVECIHAYENPCQLSGRRILESARA